MMRYIVFPLLIIQWIDSTDQRLLCTKLPVRVMLDILFYYCYMDYQCNQQRMLSDAVQHNSNGIVAMTY